MKCLIFIFNDNNTSEEIVAHFLRKEIESCDDTTELFRNDSIASKFYMQWGRIFGMKYLFKLLAPFSQQVQSSDSSVIDLLQLNIDLDDDTIDVDTNAYKLQFVASKVVNTIFKSGDIIPRYYWVIYFNIRDFRILFNALLQNSEDDLFYFASSGLLYNNLIIPALLMPDYYGILPKAPNENTQRTLKLMSSLIQNIADKRVPQGAEYLNSLTGFIQRCIDKSEVFCKSLVV